MKAELDLPLLFDPGESWAYGPSTRVLGHVVELIHNPFTISSSSTGTLLS